MAEMLIQSESLVAIADKIRVLKDISQSMSLDDMEAQLDIPKNDSSDLTASGATVTVPSGYYASQATKSVATATQATPSVSIDSAGKITASATQTAGYVSAGTKTGTKQLTTQAAKTVTPTKSSQTAVASGVYTTGAVTVGAIPSQYVDNSTVDAVESDVMNGKKFGANGSVKTGTFSLDSELSTQDDLITQIQSVVNELPDVSDLEPVLQEKTVTPSTSSQNVVPDTGYDGLSIVTVNAMPTATQATPSISVNSSGLITASATQTAGYVASGTKSATKQLTTQAAKTVTPSTSEQTVVTSGVYTTGAVKVAAIPSTYVKPSATKGATTYMPTTSNQTIAAGTYCSGVQTIKGDANLKAENIKSGVSIFGVTGTASSGGSGGGSVETCTVNLINYARDTVDFYYTQYINGSISSSVGCVYDDDSEIKNNVLKNTYIIVLTDELIDVSGSQYVSTPISGVQHIYLLDDTVTITIG